MTDLVRSTNLIKDTLFFVKGFLESNITDPITSTRPTADKFVLVSYPSRNTTYPLITVKQVNYSDRKLGMQSTVREVRVRVEVRVWALSPTQRDTISDEIYSDVRLGELTVSTGFKDNGLHDLTLLSSVNVNEPEGKVFSNVMEYEFMYITDS